MPYDKSYVNKMGWEEYDGLFETLLEKLNRVQVTREISFDAIVPIIRTGAVPGMMLANRLNILNIIPIQYKYDYSVNKPVLLMSPKLNQPIKAATPNILIVEGSIYSGRTAKLVRDELDKLLPNSKLHLASLTKVYDDEDLSKYFDSFTYATYTNEALKLESKDAKKQGIREGVTIFPWEEVAAELADSSQ